MTATALPPIHAAYVGGDPTVALAEARSIIEHSITHQPRSLQKRIGPSELGTPCDHCLAAKLAGWTRTDDGIPWLPYVGTAVHAALEEAFIQWDNDLNTVHKAGRRYLAEQSVMVGHLAGEEIWGSCDLFDLEVGMTVDWKIVGASTLRTAKKGPSPVYRTQAHLYGRGWANAGYTVRHVAIAYLPRNSVSLGDAIWWTEPYDPAISEQALERANRLHANLTALASISTEAQDAWITSLPRDRGCYDCSRFPDGAGIPKPGHTPPRDQLAGLIAPASNTADGNPAAQTA